MNFKIFPYGILPDGRKAPLINDWDLKCSNDPNQIRQWQEFFRDRIKGWGLPTGAVNGIYAIDIDVKEGRNGFDWFNSRGIVLPSTMHQYTPSGGLHLFFRYDPNVATKNSVNRETGIDSRGDRGFVWLYNLVVGNGPAPLPPWIHEVLAKPLDKPVEHTNNVVQLHPELAMQRFNQAIQAVRNAAQGERNVTLNTQSYIIGQLVESGAVSKEYAEQQLWEAAQSIGLNAGEINATVRSGLKGGQANPFTHPFGDAPPVPAIKIEAPLPVVETPTRWTPRFGTLNDLTSWQYLRKPQLFEDWSSQDPILTSAIGGVGKSTLKLYEAVCLALGEPFLGFNCLKPGRTLFIIGEDSEAKMYAMLGRICKQLGLLEPGQEHRIDAVLNNVVIKLARDICLVQFNKITNSYVPNQESMSKLKEAIDDLQPVQIVFDPIAMFWGPESGGNDMAMALSRSLLEIIEYSNASIDSIAHIGKDSATKKDMGQFSARGATALANHSRVIRTLISMDPAEFEDETGEKLSEGQSAIKCYVSKFSDGSPLLGKPFIILRDGYLFSRKAITEQRQETVGADDKNRIFAMIKVNSREDRPVTTNDVVDWAYTQNPRINKSTTRSIIGNLKFEGVIEEVPHSDITVGNWLRIKS